MGDFFDTPPRVESPPNWWDALRVLHKTKKILYCSTAFVLLCSFATLVLCCVAVANPTMENARGLVGGAIAMALLTLATGCVQVVLFKEKDIIVSI